MELMIAWQEDIEIRADFWSFLQEEEKNAEKKRKWLDSCV